MGNFTHLNPRLGGFLAGLGLLTLGATLEAEAQVGIGTTSPNSSAVLDLQSSGNDKGLLIPRLTQAQRTAIAAPADGLMVFQTDNTTGFWYYFGGAWLNLPNATTAGDNLGNHNATQNLNLADRDLLLRGSSSNDTNHGLGYYGPSKLWNGLSVDGPVLYGYSRGILGTNVAGTKASVLIWNNLGNVGIGNTSPTQRLDVTGNTLVTGNSYVTGNVGVGTTSPDRPLTVQGSGGSNELLTFKDNTGASQWHWNLNTGTGLNLVETGVADARLFVRDGGNVGIGTNNPGARLDVNGVLGIGTGDGDKMYLTNAYANGSKLSHSAGWSLDYNAGPGAAGSGTEGQHRFFTSISGAYQERMRIGSSGNVGIGTTSPGKKLDVSTTSEDDGVRVTNTTNSTAVGIYTNNNGPFLSLNNGTANNFGITGWIQQRPATDANPNHINYHNNNGTTHSFTSSAGVRMGVGTSSPTEMVHVENGNLLVNGESTGIIVDSDGAKRIGLIKYLGREAGIWRTMDANNLFEIGRVQGVTSLPGTPTGYLTDIAVTNDGFVGIGTSSPATTLHVAGTSGTSNVRIESLAGAGTRMVTANSSGNLSTAALPTDTDAQTLSISGGAITISGSNSTVTVPDASATNELQTISKAGTTVTLSNGGGSFTDADTQTLGISGGTITISGSNSTVTVPDASATNELQTISKVGSTVTLSNGGGSFTDTDTDAQQLSIAGSTISLSNGGSVTVPSSADNLGNHTATQSLNLGTNKLVGNGSTNGLRIGSNGELFTEGTNLAIGDYLGTNLNQSAQGFNVLVGYDAGTVLTSDYNTLIGARSGLVLTTGQQNTMLGLNSGNATTTGSGNVFLGNGTGQVNTTGSRNTIVGYLANVGANNLTNATAIGFNAQVNQSNSLVLGGTGTAAVLVGIGTAAPAATFHVEGASSTVRLAGLGGAGTRMVTADVNGTLSTAAVPTGESTTAGNGLTLSGSQVQLGGTLSSATTIATASFGLGLSGTAQNLLSLTGSATSGTWLNLTNSSAGASQWSLISTGSAYSEGAGRLLFRDQTNGAVRAIIDPSGQFGIGTVAPTSRLHVVGTTRLEGSAQTTGTFQLNSTDGEKLLLTDQGSNGSKIAHSTGWSVDNYAGPGNTATTGMHRFFTTSGNAYQERLRIDGSGNVGIGTTTTTNYKLTVAGGPVRIGAVGGEGDLHGVDQIVGLNDLRFYTDDAGTTERLRIQGSGEVGIGTSAPNSMLQVNGAVSMPYTTTGTAASFTLTNAHQTLRRFSNCGTITIPDASTCAGRIYTIINSNGTVSNVNLTVSAGTGIYDDVTNLTITSLAPNNRITIQSDGTGWIVVGR